MDKKKESRQKKALKCQTHKIMTVFRQQKNVVCSECGESWEFEFQPPVCTNDLHLFQMGSDGSTTGKCISCNLTESEIIKPRVNATLKTLASLRSEAP